ncbi:hypothetical protein BC936DRAFT_146001, partial [Jimgerdemannia flammicorona]
ELEQKAVKEAEARPELGRKTEEEAEARLELKRSLEKDKTENALEKKQRKLEQFIQASPQVMIVEHRSSGSKPSRSSKENGKHQPFIKRGHTDPPKKVFDGPPRSRTQHAVAPDRLAAKSNASYSLASVEGKASVPSSCQQSLMGPIDNHPKR